VNAGSRMCIAMTQKNWNRDNKMASKDINPPESVRYGGPDYSTWMRAPRPSGRGYTGDAGEHHISEAERRDPCLKHMLHKPRAGC
jgi:hypothetical protein